MILSLVLFLWSTAETDREPSIVMLITFLVSMFLSGSQDFALITFLKRGLK